MPNVRRSMVQTEVNNDGSQEMEKASVLIVDDEAIMRESLSAWLEEEGFAVHAEAEALAAIHYVEEHPVDVAVVDIKMPGMDGVTLLKKLHELRYDLPVVMITAHATVESAIQSMKEGAYDYLMKPFPPEKLTNVIRRVVEHRRLLAENIRLRKERKQVLHIAITALVTLVVLLVAAYFLFGS